MIARDRVRAAGYPNPDGSRTPRSRQRAEGMTDREGVDVINLTDLLGQAS